MTMLLNNYLLLLILLLVVTIATGQRISADDGKVCLATYAEADEEEDCATQHSKIGLVEPSHVAQTTVYNDWTNGTVTLDGETLKESKGSITWPAPLDRETKFSVLPGLLRKKTIAKVLKLLNPSKVNFDETLDSVDAMPTREIYLHEGDALGGGEEKSKTKLKRRKMRRKLRKILAVAEKKITSMVRATYPEVCARGHGRSCRSCFSLVRRYLPNERTTHNIHRDGQALVTAVVSLSDYGRDFLGGLYVAANGVGRQVIALRKGDVILHQYDLLHGVQVDDFSEDRPSVRWSWILWFKDSSKCEQRGYEWSRDCAKKGDALCQYFLGWRVHLNPSISKHKKDALREQYMTLSAEQGFAEAAFKVGRNHFGRRNLTGAVWWLHKSHLGGEADASYQLGHILLNGLLKPSCIAPGENKVLAAQIEALALFEKAAVAGASPFGGAQFAMYNIGIAWLFGFAGLPRNPNIAARWFLASRLPEGYMAYSLYLKNMGRKREADKVVAKAKSQGFPRNRNARDQALFSLHSNWPKGPPQW